VDKVSYGQVAGQSSVRIRNWYRVYVNNSSDLDQRWIVDLGTVQTSIYCFKVIFMTAFMPASTSTEKRLINELEPSEWISVCGVLHESHDALGRKVITITEK
jgi:hypothetical protein